MACSLKSFKVLKWGNLDLSCTAGLDMTTKGLWQIKNLKRVCQRKAKLWKAHKMGGGKAGYAKAEKL